MRRSISYIAPFWVLFVAGMVFSLKAFGGGCIKELSSYTQHPCEDLQKVREVVCSETPNGIHVEGEGDYDWTDKGYCRQQSANSSLNNPEDRYDYSDD